MKKEVGRRPHLEYPIVLGLIGYRRESACNIQDNCIRCGVGESLRDQQLMRVVLN